MSGSDTPLWLTGSKAGVVVDRRKVIDKSWRGHKTGPKQRRAGRNNKKEKNMGYITTEDGIQISYKEWGNGQPNGSRQV
jgi:hypothetical protein